MTAARSVASDFIAEGVVFWEQDANGAQTPTRAEAGGAATGADLDHRRASSTVAARPRARSSPGRCRTRSARRSSAQQSFGKGTVQQWQELGDGGAFKLTIARWLTPDKRWIHDVGLTPDVAVEIPEGTPADQDVILDRAIEFLGGSAQVEWRIAA